MKRAELDSFSAGTPKAARSLKNSLPRIAVNISDLFSKRSVLGPDEVHVWQAKLDDRLLDSLATFLSQDERERGKKFRFARDQNRFIVGRGLLRAILSSYVGTAPHDLNFSYGDKGKPALAGMGNSIRFNLAHSGEMAVYAVSLNRELGIDLEYFREELADEDVARRFFSACEVRSLFSIPVEIRRVAFFNCWTRKEAYIKARGEGLSMPLQNFDVAFEPGKPAALVRNHVDPIESVRWSMKALDVPPGYAAALVVEGQDWQLKRFDLHL